MYFDKLFTNVILIIWRNHSWLMLIQTVLRRFDEHAPRACISCVMTQMYFFYIFVFNTLTVALFPLLYYVDSIGFLFVRSFTHMRSMGKKKGLSRATWEILLSVKVTDKLKKANNLTETVQPLNKSKTMSKPQNKKYYQPSKSGKHKNVIKNTTGKTLQQKHEKKREKKIL